MPQEYFTKRVKKFVLPILFFIGVLISWELLVKLFAIPNYLLPQPTKIIVNVLLNFNYFSSHIIITLIESFLGFFLCIIRL